MAWMISLITPFSPHALLESGPTRIPFSSTNCTDMYSRTWRSLLDTQFGMASSIKSGTIEAHKIWRSPPVSNRASWHTLILLFPRQISL